VSRESGSEQVMKGYREGGSRWRRGVDYREGGRCRKGDRK